MLLTTRTDAIRSGIEEINCWQYCGVIFWTQISKIFNLKSFNEFGFMRYIFCLTNDHQFSIRLRSVLFHFLGGYTLTGTHSTDLPIPAFGSWLVWIKLWFCLTRFNISAIVHNNPKTWISAPVCEGLALESRHLYGAVNETNFYFMKNIFPLHSSVF